MKSGAGIDYSGGKANVDSVTGIHYGVISQNEVLQAWADSSEPWYGEMWCDACGEKVEMSDDRCPKCDADLNSQFDFIEPVSYYYELEGYYAEAGSDGDIFITKSPYYTKCAFCSPCAPGAGYIMDSREDGIRAFCFDHSWFESGVAPYVVYDVKTNEIVNP